MYQRVHKLCHHRHRMGHESGKDFTYTYKRSYSELANLGINTDSIKRDNQKVLFVAGEWQIAEDIITLPLKQRLSSYQEELESLTSLKQRKERVSDAGIKKLKDKLS